MYAKLGSKKEFELSQANFCEVLKIQHENQYNFLASTITV